MGDISKQVREIAAAGGELSSGLAQLSELLLASSSITDCAVFLERGSEDDGAVFHAGTEEIPQPLETASEREERRTKGQSLYCLAFDTGVYYYDLFANGISVGTFGFCAPGGLKAEEQEKVAEVAFTAALLIDRHLTQNRLTHLAERLEVLGEFNQLIATGGNLDRLAKTLARQAAYRFSADVAIVFVLTDAGDALEVMGSYGRDQLPKRVSLQNTLLGRALRVGGMMTVPDLRSQADHGLEALVKGGIYGIHTSTLEVKNDTLGALLIGYRAPCYLTEEETALYEEFSRGAAAAVGTARNQASLTAYAEKLEDLVQQRTVDLARQTEKAQEANRAKSRFVANMSHELRTPLTAIIGYSSVLRDEVFGPINEKQRDALISVAKSSEHLKELIDEVLNLSRIEAGKEDPEPSRVELYSLLQQVSKLMLQTAVGKGVKVLPLQVAEEIRLHKLWVDPRHVRQILLNLLSNAVKYTPAEGTVQIAAEIIGDKVKVSVIDTGVGISAEELQRLFTRFERGDDSYSQAQMGTGLGLSLTKHLTEINGGRIGVESEKGKGSTFWVLIPLADSTPVADEAQDGGGLDGVFSGRLEGLNILIVDDNTLSCEMLATIVTTAGGRAYTCTDVPQAKAVVEQEHLDVALVDLAIPGEDGLSLIDHLRNHSDEPVRTIPIVVVSACVFDNDREAAMRSGATYFIPKPFRPLDVVKTIRQLTISSVVDSAVHFHVVR